MASRDRLSALVLLALGGLVWLGLVVVLITVSPDSLQVKLLVALAIGVAVGLTVTPLAWLAAFARRGRLTRPGDWPRASRRGALAAVIAALLAALQVTGTTSLPVVVFAVALVFFVELTLSYRR